MGRLDPASRALLDLSLRRGMRPEEIGDLLGTDPESVIVAREAALEQLAHELGVEEAPDFDDLRTRLSTLPSEAWTPAADEAEEPEEQPRLRVAPEGRAAAKGKPTERRPAEPKERQRSRLPWLLALLAVATIALLVVLASGGSDDENGASNRAAQPSGSKPAAPAKPVRKPAAKPAPAAAKVTLAPVGGAGDANGSASLVDGGKRLRLDVTGLSPGTYEVWLYDSVIDATLIGKATGTKIALDAKLPPDATKYTYVDVSREPPDGNPNHSGASVLRVPLAKLSR